MDTIVIAPLLEKLISNNLTALLRLVLGELILYTVAHSQYGFFATNLSSDMAGFSEIFPLFWMKT
jgi:hypothetical protein